MTDQLVVLVPALPLAGGVAAWFTSGRAALVCALASLLPALLGVAALVATVVSSGPLVALDGLVLVDGLGALLIGSAALVSGIVLAGSPRHLAHEASAGRLRARDDGRYYALLLWFTAGLLAVPLVDDLGLMWVALEATTIVSALLVGFSRTPSAIEAAWKTLILGSIGVGFALLATMLIYASSVGPVDGDLVDGAAGGLSWSHLLAIATTLDPALVRLAFVLALAGYGTKAGLVPFHTWLPDAHSQAPSPISGLLSGASLGVALYGLARFQAIADGALGAGFSSTLLVAAGLLGLAVALPFLVAQGDLKRLLAFSSVEHMGISVLALGFGGPVALAGFGLHMVNHGLAKAVAFLSAGQIVEMRGSRRMGRLRGALSGSGPDGTALLVSLLMLAGLPPSGIFVAEVAIVWGGFQAGWGPAAALAALLMGLCMAALLFHLLALGPGRRIVSFSGARGPARSLLLGAPLLVVALLGLWTPAWLSDALDALVASLAGPHV